MTRPTITSFCLPPDMLDQLQQEAKIQGLSTSAFLRALFNAWLEAKKAKEEGRL